MKNAPSLGINLVDTDTIESLTSTHSTGFITLTIETSDTVTFDVAVNRLIEAVRNLGDSAHIQLKTERRVHTTLENDLF